MINKSLKGKASSGPDEIPGNLIFHSFNQIKEPMLFLIDESLVQGIFPAQLKISKSIPINKNKVSSNDFDSCRPIAIQNSPSKIFEKVLLNMLTATLFFVHISWDAIGVFFGVAEYYITSLRNIIAHECNIHF
jgi:hypothetical protein